MANEKLNKAKADIKRIEQFIYSSPRPSMGDLKTFLMSENLTDYTDFAESAYKTAEIKAFHLFKNQTNKFRG